MSTTIEAIQSAPDAPRRTARRYTGPTGAAPLIRRAKQRNPNLTNTEIARRVGCSPSNVDYVLKRYLGKNNEADLRQFQDNQADAFDAVAMRSLLSITPKKLATASAVQLMTAAAIATDKARLVRGQATGINVNVLMDVVEAIRLRGSQPAQPSPISGASVGE